MDSSELEPQERNESPTEDPAEVLAQDLTEGTQSLLERDEPAVEVEEMEGEGTEPLEPLSLEARISALLFVATRPLTAQQLSEAADADTEAVEEAIAALRTVYSEEKLGVELLEIAGAFQLRTAARAKSTIHRLIPPKARRLSRAAAETLAVVAYKQPVQRAEVEAIRGVDALPTLKTLLEARLIRIVGRESSVGQPALYGTTQTFLEKFGLRDLSELPSVRELTELANEPGESAQDGAAG